MRSGKCGRKSKTDLHAAGKVILKSQKTQVSLKTVCHGTSQERPRVVGNKAQASEDRAQKKHLHSNRSMDVYELRQKCKKEKGRFGIEDIHNHPLSKDRG
jgi:hypothetical protein